jgi:hypothetical protein
MNCEPERCASLYGRIALGSQLSSFRALQGAVRLPYCHILPHKIIIAAQVADVALSDYILWQDCADARSAQL